MLINKIIQIVELVIKMLTFESQYKTLFFVKLEREKGCGLS